MRALIQRAMYQSDDLVVVFDYVDSKGNASRRVVSPIRFVGEDRFLGLCLSREEPRQFYLSRCQNVRIGMAANFMMPVPLMTIAATPVAAVAV
jgi:predicted DNA-binding transcriptional regulator YafY